MGLLKKVNHNGKQAPWTWSFPSPLKFYILSLILFTWKSIANLIIDFCESSS